MQPRAAALSVLASLLACGEIDGSQPFAGTAEYRPADGAYRMRLLSPPWLLVSAQGEVAEFAIAPSELSADTAHATVTLHVEPVPLRAPSAAAAALATYTAQHPGAQITAALGPVRNTAGQTGVEFSAFDGATRTYHREAFFDAIEGAFRLAFSGVVRLDVPDVTSVITGFSARTREGTF